MRIQIFQPSSKPKRSIQSFNNLPTASLAVYQQECCSAVQTSGAQRTIPRTGREKLGIAPTSPIRIYPRPHADDEVTSKRSCMMERLNHFPSFLPASGKVPMGTKPNDACRATDGALTPQMQATML